MPRHSSDPSPPRLLRKFDPPPASALTPAGAFRGLTEPARYSMPGGPKPRQMSREDAMDLILGAALLGWL